MAETGLTPAPASGQQPLNLAAAPIAPSFDPLELLPRAAAERLRALRQRAKDAHAVVPLFEDVRQASMARVEAERALSRLTDHPQHGGFNLAPDNRSVTDAQARLANAEDEFRRLQERQEVRAAAWQAATAALQAVETWLKDGRPGGTALEDWDGPEPQLLKGEKGLLDAIENRRRRVRELKATVHTIRSAPMPSSHAKAQMRAQVEALAMQGAPSVSNLVEHDGKVEWPTTQIKSLVHGAERALAFSETADAVALVAWLHREALIAALDREITAESDDATALSHPDRQKAEAAVMSDLLAVERDEAALVWRGQDEKLPCEHRPDISPLALLGVALVTAPGATNGQGSSWMHAWDLVRPGG